MDDVDRTHNQYLGELASAPIVATAVPEEPHHVGRLKKAKIEARPAVEQYMWEGNVLDCSIDSSVNLYVPTTELLGDARWVGHRAEWTHDGRVIARFIEVDDGEGTQDVLLADPEWLEARLENLGCDLVIGTLSERRAQPPNAKDYENVLFSYVWYTALLRVGQPNETFGPGLKLHDADEADDELIDDEDTNVEMPPEIVDLLAGYLPTPFESPSNDAGVAPETGVGNDDG